MDFFYSQESLTAAQWALRAVVAFFFMVVVAKALGQRAISQLRLLDFVIALVIGNIIAHPLSDENIDLKGSMITTIVLVALYLCGIFGILKSQSLRKIFNNSPVIVVKDGEIIYKGLKKARISLDILLEELREAKAEDVKKVALAIWEADGKMSVFLHPKYEPVTPSFYQMEAQAFDFPVTVVKEGKIDYNELKQINRDEDWLKSGLKNLYQTDVKKVLLCTVNNKGELKVFLYK
ncbi:MAG: hypothetical protein BWY15_00187 [Firmicutes bacterium ADurb.Bin193]|nr:MAG: hypothetical protein BWY15_00187 [Firmicutes bacterium ADurb.Bin193]